MNCKDLIKSDIFKTIGSVADSCGLECHVIGGYVRDMILKRRQPKDIDIVCIGSGIEFAQKVSDSLPQKTKVNYFKNFGTAMLRCGDWEIEFVGARRESYCRASRKPVCEDGTLEDDQKRRDFTINALAVSLNRDTYGNLLDPFNGLDDLKSKLIRTPLDPDITFSDDPLRMLRAIRFAAQLDFVIFPESMDAIKRNKERLAIISWERIAEELNRIMLTEKPSAGLKLLDRAGLLDYILPELSALKTKELGHKDNFWHSLEVLDNISRETDKLFLRYAALLHDVGKATCKAWDKKLGWTFHNHEWVGGQKIVPKIFKRLRLPLGNEMKYVQKLIVLSSRPIAAAEDVAGDSAIRRLLFDASDDIDDLMTLCEADITTKNTEKRRLYLDNFSHVRRRLVEVEEKDRLRAWQPPVSGEEIMATFNLKPGPMVGEIKSAIREAILDGLIENSYDSAHAFMLEKAGELGIL